MKLYTDNKGRWAGTQADAKQFDAFEQVEVPTDKPNLLEFLNKHSVGGDGFRVDALVDDDWEMPPVWRGLLKKTHPLSCSANPNVFDVRDAVLNCDREHLAAALGAIISRLHDEVEEV